MATTKTKTMRELCEEAERARTRAEVRAIAERVRALASRDVATLVAWNIWLCDSLDVRAASLPAD